ncbi:stage II sporulation protein M [Candidatus Nanohalococcus occultus]|uniref:Membrane protein, a component ofa putative membrane remodelling system n=1 Tax=Candidatus Nanohalococcus occultus TaxID=2978047 RepID=A0ABY8CHU1_9ARCH|nr:putative membrane protein, a component ofa putative membrane remodelling system [Candidatus Nanohaloarchaeota archaeon SVXNc]
MLPELILREEKQKNYPLLFSLGLVSALVGIKLAQVLFPGKSAFAAVMFAAIPMVFPLVDVFLKDEREKEAHSPEIMIYSALFAGQVIGFYAASLIDPSLFGMQVSVFELRLVEFGVTGYATGGPSFVSILVNNMTVFSFIFAVSALIGSAGAFILSWNASVLGVFLGVLTSELSDLEVLTGDGMVPTPLAYVPHAAFEMGGFIVAGILGTMMSAAVYRRHFDRDTWEDLTKLFFTGIAMVVTGAALEMGDVTVFFAGFVSVIGLSFWMR